jgi:multidrug resistance efflux pump
MQFNRIESLPLLGFLLASGLIFTSCSKTPPQSAQSAPQPTPVPAPARSSTYTSPANGHRIVRATGIIRALEWQMIRVPQISGSGVRFTLTRVIPNGSKVKKGDILVEFDRVSLLDDERDAKAKLSDIGHQLDQQKAQVRSDEAKRLAAIRGAEADLAKAFLELKKGPILSEIDRLKNESRAENAKLRVASLKKSDESRKAAGKATVRVLELKLERQRVTLERTQNNLDKLQIKAPQDGMVSLENTWHSGSMGPSREGDQVWPGVPLLRIFNPTRMVVEATVNESDASWLGKQVKAKLYLDAYPGAVFDANLENASPVATGGIDSPVRSFIAIFRIEQEDPRLLPDLSAALEIDETAAMTGTVKVVASRAGGQK